MKLIDQYIQAIGSKLPLKGRADIKRELEGLIMEDIESRYGNDPSEKEVLEALRAFGSPQSVALRYTEHHAAISPKLTPLYLMLIQIVPGAIAIAFAVVTIIKAVTGEADETQPIALIGEFVSSLFASALSAVGAISIGFVAATRFIPDAYVDPGEDWNPEELKAVELETNRESPVESIVTVATIAVTAILMNVYPQLLSRLESLFLSTGLAANSHHLVDIERFTFYIALFNPVWAVQAVRSVFSISGRIRPHTYVITGAVTDLASAALHWAMVLDLSLYAQYTGIVGFRLIFLIVAIIETIELASLAVRTLIRKMEYVGA